MSENLKCDKVIKLLAQIAHGTQNHIYGNSVQRVVRIPRTEMMARARAVCVELGVDFHAVATKGD
jgi:hypothetical protein